MVQSLEQYIAEATNAYKPASQAIQAQLDSLASQLNTANEQINRNYAQQQTQLENQRNQAAESASLQAAGSGGSFGGAANLANRKYYEQSFVPAVTQLQTNQTNELAAARQANENQRTNLNAQLANLQAEANKQALAQYYADLEAERQREAQRRAQAQANASQNAYYKYLMDAMKNNNNSSVKKWDFGNGFALYQGDDGTAVYTKNGNRISAGQFLNSTGANGARWDLWNDIWNNGVSTVGVGSDTVEAFNRFSPRGYDYLF